MNFSKWEGLGNDFVVLDARTALPPDLPGLAVAMCDRHRGVGADGLALITSGFGMEIYNADGSRAQMCGNALRCLAAYAVQEDPSLGGHWMDIETASGVRRARVLSRKPWEVEVDMGAPGPLRETEVLLDGVPHRALWTSMGNPHCVIPVEEFGDWQRHGQGFDDVNVEFTRIHPDHLEVKVWERGAGATLACGTGACAAVVALSQVDLSPRHNRVNLPGGDLDIDWQDTVLMRGPAREVFRGEWRPQ